MGISDYSFLILVLITALPTIDLSCALTVKDVKTLEASTQSLAVTPSRDLPQWTVRDDSNAVCMMMAMKATIQFDPEILIPSTATATQKTGSCDSENAWFTLEWSSVGITYTVSILFQADGNTFKMVEIKGTVTEGLNFFGWSDKSSSYPSASIGNSMTCKKMNSGTVYFTEYQFQPFAQQSKEQYGKAEVCSFARMQSFWGYVVLVVIILVVVAVIAGVVLIIVKKVRTKRGYAQIQ